jgi:maltose alpha-D-glucosyltransferase/alpha-amylase
MQRPTTSTGAASPAPIEQTRPGIADDPLWYRDAVIYQVHVRAFFDSNDDGVGDFRGLSQKLDYIQSLGVSAIWLLPFYPSPLRDDGYDIADYQGVHQIYGTRRDFRAFLDEAHERGLRVITELVINHTSDQHAWFQAARRAKRGTSKREFYVWSDTDQRYAGVPIVFQDTEPSNWTWDPVAGQYFWHRFFRHQPDLNFDNPRVTKAVLRVMRFWLDMGVDGMRLDAVPYLVEREGTQCANLPETHAILKEIRRELDRRYSGRMLLAEANQWPSDVRAYFGDGDECHMAFHFPLMPRLYMALRQEDRHPISEILYQMPEIPETCQWAIFLRNHDELTLEMVSDEERDYMYATYAADPQMRLNAGIRRRLAPLLENSRPRIELLHGLLMSLPGTPVLYYGDEIGMGDNVYLGDRNGVRTPMQWSADRNGGFSRADPARLFAPLIMDSVYGYASVNVEAQDRSPHSLLAWMRRTISLRQRHVSTFGRGTIELLRPANRRILAFIRRFDPEDPILVVANLSRAMQAVNLDLARLSGLVPVEMFGGAELPRISDAPYMLTLAPYAFYWLRLHREAPSDITARMPGEPESERPPLLVGPDWTTLLDGSIRVTLERRYLPAFLTRQSWFERRSAPIARVEISDWSHLARGPEPFFIMCLTVAFADGHTARYIVPALASRGERAIEIARDSPDAVIVTLAGAGKGVLHTRLDGALARHLASLALSGREIRLRSGHLHPRRLPGFDSLQVPANVDAIPHAPLDLTRFRSHASIGERLMVKTLWRSWPAPSSEVEVLTFLTAGVGYRRVPVPAAVVDYEDGQGETFPAVLVTSYLPHQNTAWQYTIDELSRFFDEAMTLDLPQAPAPGLAAWWSGSRFGFMVESMSVYGRTAGAIGARVAELHAALGAAPADHQTARRDWARRASSAWDRARAALEHASGLSEPAARLSMDLLQRERDVLETIRRASGAAPAGQPPARIHGTLDLNHVLLYEGDALFVGPVSDANVPPDDRVRDDHPFADLAALVWSLERATAVGLAAQIAARPTEHDRLAAWSRWWVAAGAASLLAAYRQGVVDAGRLPSTLDEAASLLSLLVFERAFLDLEQAASSTPEWLEPTLLAVLQLTR